VTRVDDSSLSPQRFPGHDGGRWAPVQARTVASWPPGHFAENLAVGPAGDVFVSLHSHNRIDRFDPGTGSVSTFATLPAPVAGLAFSDDGALWATGGERGRRPGIVWSIYPDGDAVEWVRVADAVFLNGCALLDERTLLVCESVTGRILAVDLDEPGWSTWLQDDVLRPESDDIPGANGIKVRDRWAWVSITDRDLLARVAVESDGRPGRIEIVADALRADDFAFAASGALYVATHPAHTVVRLAADQQRVTIAGPAEGAVGSTACAFGRTDADLEALYVTTNGGLWAPFEGDVQDAKLLRLEVGEPGC